MSAFRLIRVLPLIWIAPALAMKTSADIAAPASESRLYAACAPLLDPIPAVFFTIEKDGRSATLLAVSEYGGRIDRLTPAMQARVRAAPAITSGPRAKFIDEADPENNPEDNLRNERRFDLPKRLGPFGGALRVHLVAAGVPPERHDFVSPQSASNYLIERTAARDGATDETAREARNAVETILRGLGQSEREAEIRAYRRDCNLAAAVRHLAQDAGAMELPGLVRECTLSEVRRYFSSPGVVRDLLLGLEDMKGSKFPRSVREQNVETFLADAAEYRDALSEFQPTRRFRAVLLSNEIANQLEALLPEHPGLLAAVEIYTLVGEDGVLRTLERRGFTVRLDRSLQE